jgi:uncharacterized protein YdiU (UPF0061 family)
LKLAEALTIRSDLQRKVHQLRERIFRNAKVQVDEIPAEDPNELLESLEQATVELVAIIKRINTTNSQIQFDEDRYLSDSLSDRENLANKVELYRELAKQATVTQDRYKKLEIKFKPAVDVRQIQKKGDLYAKLYRELDMKIQSINWTEELL